MPECQYREKPGAPPQCKMLADAGQEFCPRHKFLAQVEDQQRHDRELHQAIDRTLKRKQPTTRGELLEQGYQAIGNGNCSKCKEPIQWFRTPNGHQQPWNPTDAPHDKATCHFATCKYAQAFRRTAA